MGDYRRHGPIKILDDNVAAGALSPSTFSDVIQLPVYASATWTLDIYHEGFGAGGAGTVDESPDGVNWRTLATLTLTAGTATLLAQSISADSRFIRIQLTNGGANGGRVVAVARPVTA